MLQAIRDHAQGWIAWIIVGLIILTFALFGIQQYAQGEKNVVVAEVNGEDVTATDFLTLYNRQKLRLQQQLGDMYDQVVKDDELRAKVLEALIESEAIQQYAKDKGMAISDQQLAAIIHAAPVFQKDGKFDQALYEEVLARNGLNVARFEYEQRRNLIEQQFKQLTLASNFATPTEVAQIASLEAQKRQAEALKVAYQPLLKTVKVTDAEIQDYYTKHQSEFVEPEKVVIDYVLLSKQDLMKKLKPSEEELKSYYEANKSSFVQPEKRRASHILIRLDAKTPEAKEKAKKEAEKILAELKQGADFAELAKKYSQDPGSAKQGGDLGFFEQGMMVKPFDDAVFSMKKGELKGPIETDFGYHIIKLTDIQPKKVLPYDEVKDRVKQQWLEEHADKQYYELLDKLTTTAYEQPDSLEPAAAVVGEQVKTSEPFSRKGGNDPITSHPKVLQAAFSDGVLKSHENSSVIDLAPGSALVLRVNKVIPEKQLSLTEVKANILSLLKNQKAKADAKQKAEALLKAVQSGKTLSSLADEKAGITWQDLGWVERSSHQVDPALLQAIFKAPKPQNNQPSYQVLALPQGDAVVLTVKAVKAGDLKDPQQKAQLEKALADVYGNSELTGRLKALLAKTEVKKFDVYKTLK